MKKKTIKKNSKILHVQKTMLGLLCVNDNKDVDVKCP
jgi:hypothetical protein